MPLPGLAFDKGKHRYTFQGRPAPGVTSALQPWTNYGLADPEALRIAQELGTDVHDAVHLHNIGQLDESSLDETVAAYLEGWIKFLDDTGAVPIYSEYRVYSARFNYAGTLDNILELGKSQRLYDVKTGATVPKTVGPQTAAYNHAHKEMTGKRLMRRYCVHLRPHEYNVIALDDPRDWDIFKAALTMHRWDTGE
jgi:hypothetical protein